MKLVLLQHLIRRIKISKAYKWHREYLKDKWTNNLTNNINMLAAMLVGFYLEKITTIILMMAAYYVIDFWTWNLYTGKAKKYVERTAFTEDHLDIEHEQKNTEDRK